MSVTPACLCEGLDHPREIFNPPGRSTIQYRTGEFAGFREALLQYSGERELQRWRPHAEADLAVQLVEWWAYLADILEFYNERIASQAYLRTADRPESPGRLVRLLGYRPRPGLAATGTLAALLNGRAGVTLPPGFQVASKPGPGKQPQIFETAAKATLGGTDIVSVDPISDGLLIHAVGGRDGVLLAGVVKSALPGDRVLLLEGATAGGNSAYLTVFASGTELSPHRQPNTRLTFTDAKLTIPAGELVANYQLLKGAISAHLWPFGGPNSDIIDLTTDPAHTIIHLEGLARQVRVGDPIVLVDQSGSTPNIFVSSARKYDEVVWFANGLAANPALPDPAQGNPIPIPHAQITLNAAMSSTWQSDRAAIEVRFLFRSVGWLVATPPTTLTLGKSWSVPEIVPGGRQPLPLGSGEHLMLEDPTGAGAELTGDSNDGTTMTLGSLPDVASELEAPMNALFALFDVTRGASVANEVVGSGDPAQTFQQFTLKKAPVTYLYVPGSPSGRDYKSTVRVWVDRIEWYEQPSFYSQAQDARVFVTREDENGKTHVQFGDGVNGARLPSGVNNVVASYRYGSGADSPAAGSLTVVVKPQPGLKAVRNPVAVTPGTDPDSPSRLRQLAPSSVLAFGRAVSADDFAAIAAQAPGVTRARAYWKWDARLRQGLVKVYVAGDKNALPNARAAVASAADPNRRVSVEAANPHDPYGQLVNLFLSIAVAPDRIPEAVVSAVAQALADPDSGLFSPSRMRIGEALYDSQINATCLAVPGVVSVADINFRIGGGHDSRSRHDPGEGGFYSILPADELVRNITTEVWPYGS